MDILVGEKSLMRANGLRALPVIALLAWGCGAPPELDETPSGSLFTDAAAQHWRLPRTLREVSGMATTPDGRLFAHDDEVAVMHELDARGERVAKRFAVGDPEHGDFEGLAITPEGAFWLVTSGGRLLRFQEGEDGAYVAFESFDSGLEEVCEIEGLAYLAAEESLILACKQNHAAEMQETVALYAWRPGGAAQLWRSIPETDLTSRAGVSRFRPSAVEIDSASGRIVLLSAFDGALAELSAEGELLSARELDRRHRQAEATAILPDGALVVGDEARGARPTLSVYDRRP